MDTRALRYRRLENAFRWLEDPTLRRCGHSRRRRFSAAMLPRNLRRIPKRAAPSIQVSPLLAELAKADSAAALKLLGTSAEGLSDDEAERRRVEHGPNVVAADQGHGRPRLFAG